MKCAGNPRLGLGMWFAVLSALLFLSATSTCGFWDTPIVESEITVAVNVAGLTPDITALYVTTTLDGKTAQQGQDVSGRLDRFAIALPLTTTGHVDIAVVGRSAEKCVVASGTVGVDIGPPPPTRYEATVTLAPAPSGARSCTLSVQVTGKGTVTSTPAGIACTGTGDQPMTCSGDFPVGQQIALATTSDPKNYGVVWKGLCTGTGPCSVNFTGPGDVSVAFAARICSPSDWCWYAPLPQGNTLRAIWGPSASDIWAVGDTGTFLHYNGMVWTAPTRTGGATNNDLYAVHGASSRDLWAVGSNGTLIHYDGQNWTAHADSGVRAPTQTLRGVFAAAANDVWAVGTQGTILHYDGQGWSTAAGSATLTTGIMYGIWGSAANDIWAVGSSGVILHYNGMMWSADPKSMSLTTNTLEAVSGSSRTNVMAVGGATAIVYDGTNWSTAPGNGLGDANSLHVPAVGNAWAAGYPTTFISGSSSHFTGSAWQVVPTGSPSAIYGIFAGSDTDVWAVGFYGAIMHYDGTAWGLAPLAVQPANTNSFQGLFGTGVSDIWAVGTGGLLRHFDGTAWATSPQSGTITNSLYGVWGVSPTNMLAVGTSGIFLKYDGSTWNTLTYSGTPTTQTLYGIWGSGLTAYAVGGGGTIVYYSGTTPSVYQNGTTTTNYLRSIYYNGSLGYYVVGEVDTRMRNFSLMTESGTTTSQQLYGVYGTTMPSNHVWAVGYPSVILHSTNGTNWTADPASGMVPSTSLFRVWVSTNNTGWIVGASGAMMRYNGTAWSPAVSGTKNALYTVWGASPTDVWAAGSNQTLLRYQP